jgi:hypothetical protein
MLKSALRSFSYKLPGKVISLEASENVKGFVAPAKVYKPESQIEFDNKGETLVYSRNTSRPYRVFFPIPDSLGTWTVPIIGLAVLQGTLSPSLPLLFGSYILILPHLRYLQNLSYTIDKISYVRGGAWKFETSGVQGVVRYAYTKIENLSFNTKAEEVLEEGELRATITVTAEEWPETFEDLENQKIKILKTGSVHNPELFQAMIQKFQIDDSDFIVNLNPENSLVSSKCLGK